MQASEVLRELGSGIMHAIVSCLYCEFEFKFQLLEYCGQSSELLKCLNAYLINK